MLYWYIFVLLATVENRVGASQTEGSCQDSRAGNREEGKRPYENVENAKNGSQKDHGRHRRRKRGKKNQQKNKWEPPPNGPRFDKSLLEKVSTISLNNKT